MLCFFLLLVALREFFLDLGSGGGGAKKINKKAPKMTSYLVIFRAFFLFFSELFFNISRNSKTSNR